MNQGTAKAVGPYAPRLRDVKRQQKSIPSQLAMSVPTATGASRMPARTLPLRISQAHVCGIDELEHLEVVKGSACAYRSYLQQYMDGHTLHSLVARKLSRCGLE
jgi:hypothetical protein